MAKEERELIDPIIYEGDAPKDSKLINPIIYDAPLKSVEQKVYLILYVLNEDLEDEIFNNIFSICIGRTDAYADIRAKLQSGLSVDVHKSKIITETRQTETDTDGKKYYLLPLEEAISVYKFCKLCETIYTTDEFTAFDVEEYNISDEADTSIIPEAEHVLTPEEEEYRKLLDIKMKSEKFLERLHQEEDGVNI